MPRIERSLLAKVDVLQIAQYIAESSHNHATAYRFLTTIDEKLTMLMRHPLGGHARPDLGEEVRSVPIGQYIMFYRPIDGGIQLIRILHSSRDIPRVFWREEM